MKLATKLLIFFILISNTLISQKQVLLDNYFNHEINVTGNEYHYTWKDTSMTGFSKLGDMFVQEGCELSELAYQPTFEYLKSASVYIIADPDNENDSKKPNCISEQAVGVIKNWVKMGGVLVLLANDFKNCDLEGLNLLSSKFGILLNYDLNFPELKPTDSSKRNFNSCSIFNLPSHPIFKDVNKIFLKEICSMNCKNQAKPILTKNKRTFIAESHYGEGYVFVVGDPWFYNEYIDNNVLPFDIQNQMAASNFVRHLVKKCQLHQL